MSIQPAEVNRDENGYWVHPELPEWDDGTTPTDIESWFSLNNLNYWIDRFEDSATATEEMHEAYYGDGDSGVPDWEPECPVKDSFLLSIHDTEDGPVAVFATPK